MSGARSDRRWEGSGPGSFRTGRGAPPQRTLHIRVKPMHDSLIKIQGELKAPKSQFNAFAKYHYRSCEDIIEAAKPLCAKYGVALTISDEIVEVGGRVYVKATASVSQADKSISVTAYAREEETKKGMDAAQITGSASSYARKYALNGLFAIDDTKDADATNDHDVKKPYPTPKTENIRTEDVPF